MKLSVAITALFFLQLALLVTSQSVSEEILKLIAKNEELRNRTLSNLSIKNDVLKLQLSKKLEENAIPAVTEAYQKINSFIENVADQVASVGYNPSSCIETVKTILSSDAVPNVTQKVINEMKTVYEQIASNTHYNADYRVQVISNEVNTISSDYVLCQKSVAPENCNRTLYNKIVSKQDELSVLYNKEVERAAVVVSGLLVNYETRVEDYIQEVIIVTKPYLALLESCVSVLLTVG